MFEPSWYTDEMDKLPVDSLIKGSCGWAMVEIDFIDDIKLTKINNRQPILEMVRRFNKVFYAK